MPIPNVQVYGGSFQDAEGNPIASGYLAVTLSHDELFTAIPSQIASGLVVKIPLDNNGNIPQNPPFYLYSTDDLLPSGSFYTVFAFTNSGVPAWSFPQIWQFDASMSPLNVGTIVPLNPPGPGLNLPVQILGGSGGGANYALSPIPDSAITETGTGVEGPTYPLIPGTFQTAPTATAPALTTLVAYISGATADITAWSITSDFATFTANNTFTIDQTVFISGLSAGSFMNGKNIMISSASSTQFTGGVTHANASATESGFAFPTNANYGALAVSEWNIVNNVLQLNKTDDFPVGAVVIMEAFSAGAFLNGQTFTVSYSAAATVTAAFSAANDSATEAGYIFANGLFKAYITSWSIVSDVITFNCANTSVPVLGTFTVQGLTHGSYLNGVTFTVSSDSTLGFCQGPFTHANANATESGVAAVYQPFSSTSATSATSAFTLGILENWSVVAQVVATGNGRFWLGVGDANYVGGAALAQPTGTRFYDKGSVMATDSPSFSFVGFRYSPSTASDTNWQAVCNNAGTQTTVDTGVAADTNAHVFAIKMVGGGSVAFSLDGNTVATIGTNLPATSLPLADELWVDNQGAPSDFAVLCAAGEFWQLS